MSVIDEVHWGGKDRISNLEDAVTAIQNGGSVSYPKQTAVLFGDSITGNNNIGENAYAAGYWHQANAQLGNRFLLLNNAGVTGNRTDQMLARIQTDVLAYSPGYVLVEGGVNDVAQDVASATIIQNLTSIYTSLLAQGITVIATTLTPSTNFNTTSRKAALYATNIWIRQYAQQTPGIVLCDWFAAVADPSTGGPATNMTQDGVHPTQTGGYQLGTALANVLASLTYPADRLPFSNAETGFVLPNPRMVGSTSGVADSLTIAADAGTPTLTKSKVARTDGLQGEWQQIVASGGTGTFRVSQQATTNVGGGQASVGDRVYGVCEVQIDSGATMVGANGEVPVSLELFDITNSSGAWDLFAASSEGTYPGTIPTGKTLVLRTPNYLIPTGATALYLRVHFGVNGTVRVGRMQVHKAASSTVYGN